MNFSEYIEVSENTGPFVFKDRGSKFYGFAAPFNDLEHFKSLTDNYRSMYPKANHIVSAYRDKPETNQSFSTDDGEPKNSSGPPVLSQIIQHNLFNTAVFVVREFGGTPLGISGLINAYKATANGILIQCEKLKITPSKSYRTRVNYGDKKGFVGIIEKHGGKIVTFNYLEVIIIELSIPLINETNFFLELKNNKRYSNLLIYESNRAN